MGIGLPTLYNRILGLRKQAYFLSFVAFLAMATCVALNSSPEQTSGAHPASYERWYRTVLESLKAVFEAIGATLLIYAVLELKIDRIVKGNKVLRKIEEIEHTAGGETIVNSIERDIAAKVDVISAVEIKLKIDKAEPLLLRAKENCGEYEIPVYDVSLTQIETVTALYDMRGSSEDYMVEQYAGDTEPWRLDTLRIEYGQGDSEDFSPPDRTVKKVSYNVRDLKRGQSYTRTVIRTRSFLRGIMENHVFLTVTNNVLIRIDADKSLTPPGKKYPINVWIAPGVMGFLPDRTDHFQTTSPSAAKRLEYQYSPQRQFLPYQGFSFFLDI